MTSTDILAVIICGAVGYWVVSRYFDRKAPTQAYTANEESYQRSDQTIRESTPRPSWFEVLGVSSLADVSEIKSAYRTLMLQYHPDRVANLGPELRQLAEEKSKQITTAYQEAMQGRPNHN